MKSVALKKKLVDIAVGRVKPDQQESSHESNSSGPTRDRNLDHNEHHSATNPNTRRMESTSAVVEQRPENSVYFHPVHNPTGAPPPGQPQLYVAKPSQQQPSTPSSNLNAVVIGGQNGIPLPPPRPPPFPGSLPPYVAPPHNSMIPPPPYPYPVPFSFGGVSAIPPPPPSQSAPLFPMHSMSMAVGMGNLYTNNGGHGQSSSSTQAESNKRRREIKRGPSDFDPLDPSAAGYVERFGRQKHQPNNEEFSQQSTAPVMDSREATHAGKLLNNPVIGKPAVHPPPPPLPPATLAATITAAVEFSSDERQPAPPDQLGGFKILTAEELMRRRHHISTGEPPVTADGPSYSGADVGPSFSGANVGPSMPAPVEFSEIESKDADEKPSVLSGLITYDSDSDQSDGGEDQDDDDKDNDKAYPYSYADMAYPPVTIESNVSYPTPSTADYFSSAAYAPGSSVPSIATVSSSVLPPPHQVVVVGSSLISGPKIIKADKALTAFVPNVLKQKKQTGTVTTSSSAGVTSISLQAKSIIEPKPSLSTATSKPTASIAVDDAYKQFFEELNVLGAI